MDRQSLGRAAAYVRSGRQNGISEAHIERALRELGWTDEDFAELWRYDPSLRDHLVVSQTPVWASALVIIVVVVCVVVFLSSLAGRTPEASPPVESPSDIVACPQCHGSGTVDGPMQRTQVRCSYCLGLAMAKCNLCDGTGRVQTPSGLSVPCYKCGGDGLRPCPVCGGQGWCWDETHPQVPCAYCRRTGKVTRRQREYWNTHYGGR